MDADFSLISSFDLADLSLQTEPETQEQYLLLNSQVKNCKLWDVESPNLYDIQYRLLNKETGKLVDSYDTCIGFRRLVFKSDGLYLNSRKLKIRGLNRHQSFPYIGYAMPESMQIMDADILKYELGLNAVRTSHYPQSHAFIKRCDEIGLLVFTEMPGWQHIGREEWKNQACVNLKEMIVQYRNHPSIFMWGVRINESKDDNSFYTRTNAIAKALDPTRARAGVRANKRSHLLEDVYTYNDFSHNGNNAGCEKKASVTSNMKKPYLITEYNGHMYPTKMCDDEEHRLSHLLRHLTMHMSSIAAISVIGVEVQLTIASTPTRTATSSSFTTRQ